MTIVQLGDYRNGANAINGENGYYDVLVTTFKPDQDYLDKNIFDERNDIVYDREADQKYEAPEHVASGVSPSGLASGTSSDATVQQNSAEIKSKNKKSNQETRHSDIVNAGNTTVNIDPETESVNPTSLPTKYSERTWNESDYVTERDEAAKELAASIGVSVKKAKSYIDSLNSVARMIADERANTRVRKLTIVQQTLYFGRR